MEMYVERNKGRSKKRCLDVIETDTKRAGVNAGDRVERKSRR